MVFIPSLTGQPPPSDILTAGVDLGINYERRVGVHKSMIIITKGEGCTRGVHVLPVPQHPTEQLQRQQALKQLMH